MQRTPPKSLSWDYIRKSAENPSEVDKGADPVNWKWEDASKVGWKLAPQPWKDFRDKWYGMVADPQPTSLSLEPLPQEIIGAFPSMLLVRESYVKMFSHIWSQVIHSDGITGTIVTGQLGNGKTLFQYYLLVRLLQRKQVVLFSMTSIVFLFYHDNVYTTTKVALDAALFGVFPKPVSSSRQIFIWSLFDIRGQHEPEMFLISRPCLPVQTTSPNPLRYKTWSKEWRPLFTALPLWTRDELFQGVQYQIKFPDLMDALRTFFSENQDISLGEDPHLIAFPGALQVIRGADVMPVSPEDAVKCLLDAAIERFGYSARDVFNAVFDFSATTREHEAAFVVPYEDLLAAASSIANPTRTPISYRILAFTPNDDGPFNRATWKVDFKSEWIGRCIIKQMGVADTSKLREQIRMLRYSPQTQSLAGQFFKPLAHHNIANFDAGSFWPLRQVISNNADPSRFTTPVVASPVPAGVKFRKVKRNIVKFQSLDEPAITSCTHPFSRMENSCKM